MSSARVEHILNLKQSHNSHPILQNVVFPLLKHLLQRPFVIFTGQCYLWEQTSMGLCYLAEKPRTTPSWVWGENGADQEIDGSRSSSGWSIRNAHI